jgi:hypothetical protein
MANGVSGHSCNNKHNITKQKIYYLHQFGPDEMPNASHIVCYNPGGGLPEIK